MSSTSTLHPMPSPRLLITLASTFAFALLAGWSVHRDSPQGLLRQTAEGCLAVSHGFTQLYLVVLGVAGGMGVVVAMSAYIGSELGLFGPRRAGLRALALSCLMFAVGAGLLALLSVPITNALPLQTPPANACPAAG